MEYTINEEQRKAVLTYMLKSTSNLPLEQPISIIHMLQGLKEIKDNNLEKNE